MCVCFLPQVPEAWFQNAIDFLDTAQAADAGLDRPEASRHPALQPVVGGNSGAVKPFPSLGAVTVAQWSDAWVGVSPGLRWQYRRHLEHRELSYALVDTGGVKSAAELQGRLSGSEEWRRSRQEMGGGGDAPTGGQGQVGAIEMSGDMGAWGEAVRRSSQVGAGMSPLAVESDWLKLPQQYSGPAGARDASDLLYTCFGNNLVTVLADAVRYDASSRAINGQFMVSLASAQLLSYNLEHSVSSTEETEGSGGGAGGEGGGHGEWKQIEWAGKMGGSWPDVTGLRIVSAAASTQRPVLYLLLEGSEGGAAASWTGLVRVQVEEGSKHRWVATDIVLQGLGTGPDGAISVWRRCSHAVPAPCAARLCQLASVGGRVFGSVVLTDEAGHSGRVLAEVEISDGGGEWAWRPVPQPDLANVRAAHTYPMTPHPTSSSRWHSPAPPFATNRLMLLVVVHRVPPSSARPFSLIGYGRSMPVAPG